MQNLNNHGYQTLKKADFLRALKGDNAGLPAKPILITFIETVIYSVLPKSYVFVITV